ncbi:hypothetical protein U3516DRAFT_771563 [Neocallimastix sp. 'constans']
MSKSQILLSNKPSSYNPILIQDNYEKEINMFVSNIPSNITEEYEFSNTKYKHINICYNDFTNKPLDYTFVTFSNEKAGITLPLGNDVSPFGFQLGESFDLVILDGQINWKNNNSDYCYVNQKNFLFNHYLYFTFTFLRNSIIKSGSSRVARLIKVQTALKNVEEVDDFENFIPSLSANTIIKEFGDSFIELYDCYWEFMYNTLSDSVNRAFTRNKRD